MNLIIIAAIGKNSELGINNQLLWHLPSDLNFFKEKTLNHTIVMGRKTFESLPGVLPNRKHIVISKKMIGNENVLVVNSIEEFFEKYSNSSETFYIIGGGQIYNQFIKYVFKMYLTHVDASFEADTFFPIFNKEEWDINLLGSGLENNLNYKHLEYIKRR